MERSFEVFRRLDAVQILSFFVTTNAGYLYDRGYSVLFSAKAAFRTFVRKIELDGKRLNNTEKNQYCTSAADNLQHTASASDTYRESSAFARTELPKRV